MGSQNGKFRARVPRKETAFEISEQQSRKEVSEALVKRNKVLDNR